MFFTVIFVVLSVGANFYLRPGRVARLLDNSYLRYKVQLPTSDSTEITAGGIKVTVTLEGPAPLDAF